MFITPPLHLRHQRFVPKKKGSEPAMPAQRLRMPRIPLLIFGDDRPDRVQFSMLSQEVRATQLINRYIPDPHNINVCETRRDAA